MSEFRPISEWTLGQHPDCIWVQTKDGEGGVAIHYDCQWMRDEGEDIKDAFTWWPGDDGNHIELDQIDCWRIATQAERDFADAELWNNSEEPKA